MHAKTRELLKQSLEEDEKAVTAIGRINTAPSSGLSGEDFEDGGRALTSALALFMAAKDQAARESRAHLKVVGEK